MKNGIKHIFFLCSFFVLFVGIEYCDYFPHEDRWMISVLESKALLWKEKDFQTKFSFTREKKVKVQLIFSSSYYDYDRKWRSRVIQKMNLLYPKIVHQVLKFGSQDLLSVFEPKLDIEWDIYLSSSLYGEYKQGKLRWKKGIY
ncbi:MAG: hypothetical protein KC646_14190 [Candidatus Cloacimonetes bacterium]|nr:hypothetical protein [Candidatus Cloacimonadota bacterium]